MDKEKKGNPFTLHFIVIGLMLAIAFSFFMYFEIFADNEFDSGNATKSCILSERVLSTQHSSFTIITGYIPKAQKAWVKYDCNNVLLTDDFNNKCYGLTGFTFFNTTKDGAGMWYCSNVSKPTLNINNNQQVNIK